MGEPQSRSEVLEKRKVACCAGSLTMRFCIHWQDPVLETKCQEVADPDKAVHSSQKARRLAVLDNARRHFVTQEVLVCSYPRSFV